jgi:hypothetical protein
MPASTPLSYIPDLWAVYFNRFQEVLAVELASGAMRFLDDQV